MQFPVEMVREVAQILQSANLGEISLEIKGAKLNLQRATFAAPPQTPLQIEEAREEAEAVLVAEQVQADFDAKITVTSPAVGVFRQAKKPLSIGDEVGKRALLGAVETLNIPTELYASQNARVIEILVADGQGVEWGQPLLVLEPMDSKS
ncbi:acetyl-CoA carboxylase biotin carboxyl carrier protein [Abditibacterium utsteinense]|uniref:acetyl-CoA carboxylase biotin carboxyl carrier protein n=1 Tax=Abditibacterium utsteinense TaxID=1960156 RepID=UPI000F46BCF5|nr:biotin/lipoyl-containing protein [Abditibacterium utsteinense]